MVEQDKQAVHIVYVKNDMMPETTETITTTSAPTSEPVHTYQSILAGCLLAVGGNLLISISLNVQKYSHMKNEALQLANQRHYTKDPFWWVGLALMVLGEIGNFSAYGFAPASLVAPLGSTTVIANMILAVIFLHEKLRPEDLFGCALAVVGAFLLVNFSSKKDLVLSADELFNSLTHAGFLVYITIVVIALVVLFLLLYKFKVDSVLVLLLITSFLATFTVITAKACSGLIQITFGGKSQLGHPIFYVMAVVMAVSAVTQVKYLNQAMKLFDATVVVPTYFVFFTISAIISGIVFYREFWGMSALSIFMFLFGCLLCFVGVYFITLGKSAGSSTTEEQDRTQKFSTSIFPAWLLSSSLSGSYSRAQIQPKSTDRRPILDGEQIDISVHYDAGRADLTDSCEESAVATIKTNGVLQNYGTNDETPNGAVSNYDAAISHKY